MPPDLDCLDPVRHSRRMFRVMSLSRREMTRGPAHDYRSTNHHLKYASRAINPDVQEPGRYISFTH